MFFDILFVCDANPHVGLGHGSRCANLANIIAKRNPRLTLAFQGTFSDSAKIFLSSRAPNVYFLGVGEAVSARVAFVDLMVDKYDPEVFPEETVNRLTETCGRVVYMASGLSAPSLPSGVLCIGYQPGGVVSRPPNLFWGLEFAPANSELPASVRVGLKRESTRALVAFGGAPDQKHVFKVIEALSGLKAITDIELIISPANPRFLGDLKVGSHQRLHREQNGASIPTLLLRSGLVITSFGNLGYEALAAGAPLCLVGLKKFQAHLAEKLQAQDVAVSAGLESEISSKTIAHAIQRTMATARELSVAGPRLIDGKGPDRIADLIISDWPIA